MEDTLEEVTIGSTADPAIDLADGASHVRRRVLAIVDEQAVTVVALDTGEVLSAHRIEPTRATGATHDETG